VTPAIRAALDALCARARGPGLVDLRLDLERAITAALPSGEAVRGPLPPRAAGARVARPAARQGADAVTYTEGQRIEFDDGAMVRIDRVADEQVYFTAFAPGEQTGAPRRMTEALFAEAVEVERRKRNVQPIAAYVDRTGVDFFADLRFDRAADGGLRIIGAASNGGAPLFTMSLDPATVAQLHAATRPPNATSAPGEDVDTVADRPFMCRLRAARDAAVKRARTMQGTPNEIDAAEGEANGLDRAVDIAMQALADIKAAKPTRKP
jgi:hypothetical protein